MEPTTHNVAPLSTLNRVKEVASTLLGFGGRSRLLRRFHATVEQGIKLDASDAYEAMNALFFNTVRIGLSLLVAGPAVFALLSSDGHISTFLEMCLCIVPTLFGTLALFNAFADRYPRSQFQKSGWEGGVGIFAAWTNEFPELNKFVRTNDIANGFSRFEFDLVQNYVFARRQTAT